MLRRLFLSSLASVILRMFALLMLFLIFRQKMTTEAFLLTHRSLLSPFASAQLAKNSQQQQQHLPLVYGTTKRKKSNTQSLPERQIKIPDYAEHDSKLNHLKKPHSRRKRMHCLSTLRKIGDPRSVPSLKDIVLRHRQMIRHQELLINNNRSLINGAVQ